MRMRPNKQLLKSPKQFMTRINLKQLCTKLLYLPPFILLIVGFYHPITAYNQDLGRHLLTGQTILKKLSVPSINLFSYTYPDFPFINHHWGSEIIFYLVKLITGDLGLFLLSLITIVAACSLIFAFVAKRSAVVPVIFTAIIYLRILFERTDLRPELFSFLFLSITITLLYSYRSRFTKLIFLLIPLELLWVNMHIYFPIGILVTLLFLIDELVTNRRNIVNTHTKTLLLVLLGMSGAVLLNPNFINGALYPLKVFQNYGYTIEENQTPFFLESLGFIKPSLIYLETAIVLLFTALIITWKKTSLIDWLLGIVFTVIAFSAVRNFPLFAIATFIPAGLGLSRATRPLQKWIRNQAPIYMITIYITLGIFFAWQMISVQKLKPIGYGVDEGAKKALDFVKNNNIKGPIFNNFDIGSYIEYRLYPQEKVFIDGRPEAYPAQFIQDTYIKMQEDPALFNKIADRYHFNSIIFSHTDQTPWAEKFIKSIVVNPHWSTVYLDPMMIVLVKKSPENQLLIQKYGLTLNKLQIQLPSNEKLLRQALHFYTEAGLSEQTEIVLLQLLRSNPTSCLALGALSKLYLQESNPKSQTYILSYQANCTK